MSTTLLNFSLLFQAWACPHFCMAGNLSLLYEEDSWPSLPRIRAFFADILSPKEINKCFCKGLLGAKVPKIIKDFSQGSYATSFMALVAQRIGNVDVARLKRMYKQLDDAERGIAEHWVKYAMFTNCVHQSFDVACPPPPSK